MDHLRSSYGPWSFSGPSSADLGPSKVLRTTNGPEMDLKRSSGGGPTTDHLLSLSLSIYIYKWGELIKNKKLGVIIIQIVSIFFRYFTLTLFVDR